MVTQPSQVRVGPGGLEPPIQGATLRSTVELGPVKLDEWGDWAFYPQRLGGLLINSYPFAAPHVCPAKGRPLSPVSTLPRWSADLGHSVTLLTACTSQ